VAGQRSKTAGSLAPVTAGSSSEVSEAPERLRVDVERAVRNVCPRWLTDQIDDLTQIATSRILQRLRDTAGTSVVLTSGYIYRAAYNALIDEIRKRRRQRELPMEPDLVPASHEESPERRAEARGIREHVSKCLSALMAARRRAVMLHLQGHSLDEICAILEEPRKKIENLAYRGLADLRRCLKARGIEP
jgi:RNA polymerase sigma-70 factor, ECF subfamily